MTEKPREPNRPPPVHPVPEDSASLLRELAEHLRQNRNQLREEWTRRIIEAKLLTAIPKEEILAEAIPVYDHYVEVLESGNVEVLEAYARNLSERIIPRGVETHEVMGIILLLRDVLARSLFAKYQADFAQLYRVLEAYEPAANRIANTVAVSFVQERERLIRRQQAAIREISTPVEEDTAFRLHELAEHFRQNRTALCEEWVKRILEAKVLTAFSQEEISAEATTVYDSYVEILESGNVEALEAYARNLSERIIPRGVETREVVEIVLLLRDVFARSLFAKYQTDVARLHRVLEAYEPAANRIANTVAVSFVQERERLIRQQPAAIHEPSTPVEEDAASLLHELAEHFRQNRTALCEEWTTRITKAKLLTALSQEELLAQAASMYDNYVEVLESGNVEVLEVYARNLFERLIPHVVAHEVVGIILLLRDVLARSLFAKYQTDVARLHRVLEAYEPAANQIASTVLTHFLVSSILYTRGSKYDQESQKP
jgi:uncharacterized protein YukE